MAANRVDIDERPYRALRRAAAQRGTTVPQLLKELAATLDQPSAGPQPSVELMMSLVGLGHSGLGDLAEHHDRYLSGEPRSSS